MNAAALLLAVLAVDAFVTSPARLREAPAAGAKAVARVPAGTRVETLGERGGFVEVAPPDLASPLARRGFLTRGALAVFPEGPEGTRELLAAGRFLVQDPDRRALGYALLSRADERLACAGARDPALLVLLGETAESLALPAGGPFRDAAALLDRSAVTDSRLRDRAEAGLLRARFPKTSEGLIALWSETAAWLELVERAEDETVLAASAPRLSRSSLALGRLLLAAGRSKDLSALEARVEGAATRLASVAPSSAPRLDGAARLLGGMRGDGGGSSPQTAIWGAGPAPLTVSIDGALGSLGLRVNGGSPAPVPVLPVPGSLRIAPDGRSAAWLEVARPDAIVPVLVHLDASGGDATMLAGGRATRDRTRKGHVLSRLLGFSPDGRRLLVSVSAWDESAPPRPRLALVETRTEELLWEGPARHAAEARARLAPYRPRKRESQ